MTRHTKLPWTALYLLPQFYVLICSLSELCVIAMLNYLHFSRWDLRAFCLPSSNLYVCCPLWLVGPSIQNSCLPDFQVCDLSQNCFNHVENLFLLHISWYMQDCAFLNTRGKNPRLKYEIRDGLAQWKEAVFSDWKDLSFQRQVMLHEVQLNSLVSYTIECNIFL